MCKTGISVVVLYYKTCPVSVVKLLELSVLFCIVTIACSTVVFTHPLLYYGVIYLCKTAVSVVVLYYKTCPVSVVKLLELS